MTLVSTLASPRWSLPLSFYVDLFPSQIRNYSCFCRVETLKKRIFGCTDCRNNRENDGKYQLFSTTHNFDYVWLNSLGWNLVWMHPYSLLNRHLLQTNKSSRCLSKKSICWLNPVRAIFFPAGQKQSGFLKSRDGTCMWRWVSPSFVRFCL